MLGCLLVTLLWIFSANCITEKPFVIGVCSYNNSRWYKKNLDSVFSQKYQNYRVIYVDDCSEDGTADLIENYVHERKQEHRFTLIRNKERRRAMANHYTIIHECEDEEIIISLDGDDWFAHSGVLKKINEIYNSDIWLAYSQFRRWPNKRLGYSKKIPRKIIQNGDYRNCPWIWGQTRTYYAWLAKKVQLKDLLLSEDHLYKGKFLPSSCDVALMLPMLEMARGRYAFIKEVLYIYNMHDLNDYRTNGDLQGFCNWAVRQLPKYQPLKHPACGVPNISIEAVICGGANQDQVLASVRQYVEGIESIYRIDEYHPPSTEMDEFRFILLVQSPINAYLDIVECVKLLEQTGAAAFFINQAEDVAYLTDYDYFLHNNNKIYFWQHGMSGDRLIGKNAAVLLSLQSVKKLFLEGRSMLNSELSPQMLTNILSFNRRDIGLFFNLSEV